MSYVATTQLNHKPEHIRLFDDVSLMLAPLCSGSKTSIHPLLQ